MEEVKKQLPPLRRKEVTESIIVQGLIQFAMEAEEMAHKVHDQSMVKLEQKARTTDRTGAKHDTER